MTKPAQDTGWRPYEAALFSLEVKRHLPVGEKLRVLEAGCGRKWDLDLSGFEYHLTGVDINKRALEDRVANEADLDLLVVGDLRTVSLPERHYDLVYNSYVLEHVKGAEEVLDRLLGWTKPSGIVVLRMPDGDSVFGFLTRHTPQLLHTLVVRHVWKNPNAGKPGWGPYPTIYDRIVSRKEIHRYCAKHSHTIMAEHHSDVPATLPKPFVLAQRTFFKAISILSWGRLAPHNHNLHFVIKKKPD